MPFPEVKRVIYKKNPLDQVVCQLRFPPILKIDSEVPADFQDRLRSDYPNLSEASLFNVQVPKGVDASSIPLEFVKQMVQSSGNKNYEFSSEDGQWKVNLTRSFIALTANKYKRWEEFRDKLVGLLGKLVDIYSPAYYTRIGLRYIDVIRRSVLGLSDINWNDLLTPYILGVMGSPDVGNDVQSHESSYEINLSDEKSIVRMITKLVKAANDSEECFMIDSDFYNSNKIEISAAIEKLDYFNSRATRLIQWCITDRLHKAMEPQVI